MKELNIFVKAPLETHKFPLTISRQQQITESQRVKSYCKLIPISYLKTGFNIDAK